MSRFVWPEVFTNSDFVFDGHKAEAIADGLSGWAICQSGGTPPKLFGQAMVKIGKVLGVSAIPENLRTLADEFLEQGR